MRRESRPKQPKELYAFVLQAGVLVLLLGVTPGIGDAYLGVLRAEGNLLFQWFGSERALRFGSAEPEYEGDFRDTVVYGLHERAPGPVVESKTTLYWRAFLPAAALAAMLLASPLPWPRRGIAVIAGVAIQSVVSLLQIAAITRAAFGVAEAVSPEEAEWWGRAVEVARRAQASRVPSIASVLLIWVVLARPQRTLRIGREIAPRAPKSEG